MVETFPALPGWTEYETAVQRYSNLAVERREHSTVLEALERGGADAAKADDDAQAAAMLAGGKDPGRKNTTRWKADLEAARTRARVLASAETQQADAITALLRSEGERAATIAQAAAEAARERYAGVLDGLLAVRDEFWQAQRVVGWLEHDLPVGRRYKATGAPPSLVDTRQYGMGAVQPESVQARRALAGFRAEVDAEPEPSEVVGYRVRRIQDVRGSDDPRTGGRSAVDSQTYTPVPVDAQGREVKR